MTQLMFWYLVIGSGLACGFQPFLRWAAWQNVKTASRLLSIVEHDRAMQVGLFVIVTFLWLPVVLHVAIFMENGKGKP